MWRGLCWRLHTHWGRRGRGLRRPVRRVHGRARHGWRWADAGAAAATAACWRGRWYAAGTTAIYRFADSALVQDGYSVRGHSLPHQPAGQHGAAAERAFVRHGGASAGRRGTAGAAIPGRVRLYCVPRFGYQGLESVGAGAVGVYGAAAAAGTSGVTPTAAAGAGLRANRRDTGYGGAVGIGSTRSATAALDGRYAAIGAASFFGTAGVCGGQCEHAGAADSGADRITGRGEGCGGASGSGERGRRTAAVARYRPTRSATTVAAESYRHRRHNRQTTGDRQQDRTPCATLRTPDDTAQWRTARHPGASARSSPRPTQCAARQPDDDDDGDGGGEGGVRLCVNDRETGKDAPGRARYFGTDTGSAQKVRQGCVVLRFTGRSRRGECTAPSGGRRPPGQLAPGYAPPQHRDVRRGGHATAVSAATERGSARWPRRGIAAVSRSSPLSAASHRGRDESSRRTEGAAAATAVVHHRVDVARDARRARRECSTRNTVTAAVDFGARHWPPAVLAIAPKTPVAAYRPAARPHSIDTLRGCSPPRC